MTGHEEKVGAQRQCAWLSQRKYLNASRLFCPDQRLMMCWVAQLGVKAVQVGQSMGQTAAVCNGADAWKCAAPAGCAL